MARQLDIKPKGYDETKLAAMLPPFNIRIEKIRGSTRSPIPLPDPEDGTPPGTGWDIDAVRQVEQWLVTEWAGGGLYEISLTDSSPQPQTLKWQPFWDPKQFPERTPPPLVEAAGANAPPPPAPQQPPMMIVPQPQQQPQQGRYNMPPIFPNGLPQGSAYPYIQAPQHQQQPYFQAPMGNPPMPGTYQWDVYQREAERREQVQREREREAEIKRMHDEKEKMARDALAAQHAAALERERQANDAKINAQAQQLSELRNMITGLASAIKDSAQRPTSSPELDAVKEQNRQMEAKMDRERAEREAERRDAATREMIRAMEERSREQIAELRRQADDRAREHAALIAAANANKGPDQLMLMWQQQQRESVELAKEMSRNQLQQMTTLQNYMMNPRDIMAMAKESSQSVDHATERVTNFFGRVIDTQQKVTENLLQMQPGSNGVVELVGNGMDRVGSLAERYLSGKQLEAQLGAQSQVQIAEAQARAYAQTMVAAQQQQAQAAQPEPQAQTEGAGLGNPIVTPPPAEQAQLVAKSKKKKKADAPASGAEIKRLGKTDAEWFGALMPQVTELRTNAAKFIQSIDPKNPKLDANGNPLGWNPEHAAGTIVQAVQIVVQRQIEIPALQEILFQNRYADFADVILPDPFVTQPYRDDLVQAIIVMARRAQGVPDDVEAPDMSTGEVDDDDDDDDDNEHEDLMAADDETGDETTDAGQNGQVVHLPPPVKPRLTSAPRRT